MQFKNNMNKQVLRLRTYMLPFIGSDVMKFILVLSNSPLPVQGTSIAIINLLTRAIK